MATGIYTRHQKACRSHDGGRCSCEPTYQAHVYDSRTRTRHRRHFRSYAEARGWRAQALAELRSGRLVKPRRTTLREACTEYLDLAEQGVVLTRGGDPYKPATIHSYRQSLTHRVYDRLGDERFDQIDLVAVQDLVDGLTAAGWAATTVVGAVTPLKAVYGRALERREVAIDPTVGVKLPRVRGGRDRIADPREAERLLAALQTRDRALWASAMYAGLRRGELMALRIEDVDLDRGLVHDVRSYDPRAREFADTKNRDRRKVPIPAVLTRLLREHLVATQRAGGLVFGVTPTRPFSATQVYKRARDAWTDAKLSRITLHECRHSYASLMIAAGVNAKALSTYMGHHSVAFTYDRYGHLMPGNEAEAAGLLDGYLASVGTPG